ncbi:Hsp20/alpha crystallin family protein [bacterium]|nr:Hsp20/alpha crystallin family protein [bacterium]MCI0604762.1 Hsp20/alpha crystallin family protein [bacterium]
MVGLERYRPFRSIDMFPEFNDLVSRLFDDQVFNVGRPQTWVPTSDIHETEDQVKIHLDLPGMSRENLDIQLTDSNTLTIRGERKFEEVDKAKYHRVERFYGNFTRSFVLPTNVDTDKITATFKDGVLEISLPKAESAKPRKITIKS